MVSDMHLWNAADNSLYNLYKIRKCLLEAGYTVDAVLTFDVVTINNVWLIFLGSKDLRQCVVTVGIANIYSEIY